MYIKMKYLRRSLIALSLLLMLSVAMLNIPTTGFGQKTIKSISNKAKILNSNTSLITEPTKFDVTINNVTIRDEIVIANDSYVLIKDTNLSMGAKITIRGRAYVVMRNVDASQLNIFVEENATLKFFNFNAEYSRISVTANATFILENSTIGSISYTSYLTSYGSLIINSLIIISEKIYSYEGRLDIYNSVFNNTKVYISNTAVFNIDNSGNFTYLQMMNETQGTITNSSAYRLNIYDNVGVSTLNVSINIINVYAGASIYIKKSFVQTLSILLPTGSVDTIQFGGRAEVSQSTIKNLNAYSAAITIINESNIDRLYYTKIYTGDITYNSSGVFATNTYDNYLVAGSGTTINVTIQNTNTRVFMHSSRTKITYVSSYQSLYFFDCNATMENLSSTLYIRSYNSTITSYNITIASYIGQKAQFRLMNSNIENAYFSVFYGEISIDGSELYSPSIYIHQANVEFANSYLNASYFYISESTLLMENSVINNTNLRFYNSYGQLRDSIIYYLVYVYNTKLQTENVTFNFVHISNIYLENAVFRINNGFVYLDSGTLLYGIEDLGSSNASSVEIDAIYVYGGNGNITGSASANGGLSIEIYYATINIENFVSSYGFIYVEAGNNTKLTIKDSQSVGSIYASNSTLNISNITLGEIRLFYSIAQITNVNASRISAYNVTINMINSNISSKIDIEFYLLETENFIAISYSKLNIANSYVKDIFVFAFGTIYINNSEIETLVYTFSEVTLEDTRITGGVLNNYLAEESITIDQNSVASGTLHSLLHIIGSTVINDMADAIVADFRDNASSSIEINNSSYAGLVVLGGNAFLYYSNFSVVVANCTGDLVIMHSNINDTMFGDTSDVFVGNAISITDSRIASNEAVFGYANIYVYDTVLGLNGIFVAYAERFNLDAVSGSVGYVFLFNVGNAQLCIGDNIEAMNSSLAVHNGYYSSIGIDNSSLYLENVDLSSLYTDNSSQIIIMRTNITRYEYSGKSIGSQLYSYAEEVNISDEYILQIYLGVPNIYTVTPSSIENSILKTIYNNSYLSTAIPMVNIFLEGYLSARIENFTGDFSIDVLYINAKGDMNPPKVDALNDTMVYEEGLEAKIMFLLDDEVPNNYTLKLNDTIIRQGTYSKNEIVIVNLETVLTTTATYIIMMIASDAKGQKTSNTTKIMAYTPEPLQIIEHPDETYNISTNETLNLTWKATDLSPKSYAILINNTEMKNATWRSGEEIFYMFPQSIEGTYNVTIVFADKLNLKTKFVVTINVEQESEQSQTSSGNENNNDLLQYLIIAVVAMVVITLVFLLIKKQKK